MQTIVLFENLTAVGPGPAVKVDQRCRTVQIVGYTASGVGSATVNVEVSNNGTDWVPYDTVVLALSTTRASAIVIVDETYTFTRGNVTAIAGTGAQTSGYMGV